MEITEKKIGLIFLLISISCYKLLKLVDYFISLGPQFVHLL